jgi:hypothetical protein
MGCRGWHYPSQKKLIKFAVQSKVLEEHSCLPGYDSVFTGQVHTFLMNLLLSSSGFMQSRNSDSLDCIEPEDGRNVLPRNVRNLLTVFGSFGGLEVACWPLVPKFAGSNPAEAVGFFRAKKSSAHLPS